MILLRDLLAVDTNDPKKGICAQLPGYRQLQFQEKVFEAWPLFSGNLCYPVPHPDPDITPTDAYHQACYTGTMWVGPYGDNRRSLLEFWIEKTADAFSAGSQNQRASSPAKGDLRALPPLQPPRLQTGV